MKRSVSKLKPKSLALLLILAFAAVAQNPMEYVTSDVARVGDRLACRCKGCKFTVGDCNMPR